MLPARVIAVQDDFTTRMSLDRLQGQVACSIVELDGRWHLSTQRVYDRVGGTSMPSGEI
jgi:hypothetical protein